jgi:hypothetical protein
MTTLKTRVTRPREHEMDEPTAQEDVDHKGIWVKFEESSMYENHNKI